MLKMNVAWSRKAGEANFGSRGASVALEVEVEAGLVREPDKLQAKIDYLFRLAKASVDGQINGDGRTEQAASGNVLNHGSTASRGHNNDQASGNGSHSGADRNGNGTNIGGRHASEKQMNFVNQLARSIRGLGVRRLETLTGRMFGKPLSDLTSLDASSLIDTLKAIKDGTVSLDAASTTEPTHEHART